MVGHSPRSPSQGARRPLHPRFMGRCLLRGREERDGGGTAPDPPVKGLAAPCIPALWVGACYAGERRGMVGAQPSIPQSRARRPLHPRFASELGQTTSTIVYGQ
ncbi:hypothetical protein [Dictyobacter alpinus]|uniref:hypothetical protein n=1 Tax=Dictyobacter alpinus TaxID=2014873 RepID=UPI000F816521|nr:hypothetical protein [Dictyobacter alpinus]